MWVSGTGIALDYKRCYWKDRTTREISADFEAGDKEASEAIERFEDRLARGLAQVINILDPDMIVIGGGVSRVKHFYEVLPRMLAAMCLGARFRRQLCRRCMEIPAGSAVRRGCGPRGQLTAF